MVNSHASTRLRDVTLAERAATAPSQATDVADRHRSTRPAPGLPDRLGQRRVHADDRATRADEVVGRDPRPAARRRATDRRRPRRLRARCATGVARTARCCSCGAPTAPVLVPRVASPRSRGRRRTGHALGRRAAVTSPSRSTHDAEQAALGRGGAPRAHAASRSSRRSPTCSWTSTTRTCCGRSPALLAAAVVGWAGVLPRRRRPAGRRRPRRAAARRPAQRRPARRRPPDAARTRRRRPRAAAARRRARPARSSSTLDGADAARRARPAWLAAASCADAALRRGDGRRDAARVVVLPCPGAGARSGVLVVVPRTAATACAALDAATRTVLDLVGAPGRPGGRQRAAVRPRAPARRDAAARDAARAGRGRRASTCGRTTRRTRRHAQVGGDWYDVLQVDARTSSASSSATSSGTTSRPPRRWGSCARWCARTRSSVTTPGPVLDRVDQLVAGMRIPRAARAWCSRR